MEYDMKNEDMLLWQSVCSGDERAFERFYTKYYAQMYSFCKAYVSPEDAEDVVDEIMAHFWDRKAEISPVGSMRNLLLCSVRNRCVSMLRKERIVTYDDGCSLVGLANSSSVADVYEAEELRRAMNEGIGSLSERYRMAFMLVYFHGKSREEASRMLKVSVKTIDYRTKRALSLLRHSLKEYV